MVSISTTGIHRRPLRVARAHQDRREPAQSVARQLGRAAVGVEELHRRAQRRRRVHDQPVGAYTAMPIAEAAGRGRQIGGFNRLGIDVEKVVAVGVRLGEGRSSCRRYFRQNARRCQP